MIYFLLLVERKLLREYVVLDLLCEFALSFCEHFHNGDAFFIKDVLGSQTTWIFLMNESKMIEIVLTSL